MLNLWFKNNRIDAMIIEWFALHRRGPIKTVYQLNKTMEKLGGDFSLVKSYIWASDGEVK